MRNIGRPLFPRRLAAALALAGAAASAGLPRFLPPEALVPFALCGVLATLAALFALSATEQDLRDAKRPAIAAAAAAALFLAIPASRATIAGLASLGVLATALTPAARSGISALRRNAAALFGAGVVFAGFAGYVGWRFAVSAPVMFSDFMICRLFAVDIAEFLRDGSGLALPAALIRSLPSEYSLLPALPPGLILAATAPLSPSIYEAAIVALYGLPALAALALWARRIASAAAPGRPQPSLALAALYVFAAAPGMANLLTAGMPDIGGVALTVLALELARRLASGLDGRSPRAGSCVPLAVQLAGALFLMFLFRRWYLFAALGVALGFLLELALVALAGRLRGRETLAAGAAAGLAATALAAPVALDWLAAPASHDYRSIYAGYNYDLATLAANFGEAYGLAVLALAGLACLGLFAFRLDNAPLRLLLVASVTAAASQLRVQSPSPHHLYLVLPLLTAPLAALGLLMPRRLAFPAAAVLAAFTLAGAPYAPAHWLPRNLPAPEPRRDVAELSRLRGWIDANATPQRRFCALGSSPVFSGVVLDALWQLSPPRAPGADPTRRASVILPQVDARDGPISADFKLCEYLLVASPVQTSLARDFMWSVALPAEEALSGQGVGAHYRRTDEVFHLAEGVEVIVLRRATALADADIAALLDRWRAAPRSETARRAAARYLDH